MDDKVRGITYAVVAAFFFSLWAIFSKLSFQYFNIYTTIFLWSGTTAIISFLIIIFTGRIKCYNPLKKYWVVLLIFLISAVISSLTAFLSLSVIGASLTAFLQRINIIFLIFLGIIFLKERFNLYEAISSAIIIIGIFLISFSEGKYIISGVILVIIHAIFISITRFIVKLRFKEIDSLIIINLKSTAVTIFVFFLAIFLNELNIYYSIGLLYATIPAIFVGIIGHYLMYNSFKLIELSKVTLILTLSPFLVTLFAFIIFGERLSVQQIIGCIVLISGIIGLIRYRNNK